MFEYRPSFKLLITGNEAPYLRSIGPEFRRRFHVYNFTRGVSNPDPQLSEKLKAEAGAILRWMIEGAVRYYSEGLAPSPAIEAANAAYFEANDLIQQWMNERCDVGEDCRIEGGLAYGDYKIWCENQGLTRPWTRQRFTSKLKAKGIESKTGTFPGHPNSVRGYFGIELSRGIDIF